MEEKLVAILNEMAEYLSIAQMKKLQEVLLKNLAENEPQKAEISNAEYLQMFLDAKKIEGCSERTLQYYRVTVERMLQSITTPIRKICTEEIRSYLSGYQQINGCGKVTVDNIRRNISSFFSWLEEEDYMCNLWFVFHLITHLLQLCNKSGKAVCGSHRHFHIGFYHTA